MRLVVLSAVLVLMPAVSVAKPSGIKWVPLSEAQNGPRKKTAQPDAPADAVQQQVPAPSAGPSSTTPSETTSRATSQRSTTDPLQLTCLGAGTANKIKSASVFGGSSHSGSVGFTPYSGSSSGWATILGTQDRPFEDQVDLRLFTGDDRKRAARFCTSNSGSWRTLSSPTGTASRTSFQVSTGSSNASTN